jgi:rRNA maturation endonuclease Nob1
MELALADFVLYLLLGSFALVPLLAILSRTLQNRVEKRALAHRVICRLCLHAFEDTSHMDAIDCPICGASNEKGRSRRLG